jgi:hypothetical protein
MLEFFTLMGVFAGSKKGFSGTGNVSSVGYLFTMPSLMGEM